MKFFVGVLSVLLVSSWTLVGQEKAKEAVDTTPGIAVVVVGVADDALAAAAAKAIKEMFRVPVRVKPMQQALADSPEKQAKSLSKLMGKEDLCLVALFTVPENVKFKDYQLASKHVALLNVWALKSGDGSKKDVYEKRVEKESLRMVGKLIGLPVCPLPICAMSQSANDQALDAKGVTLCPPCISKAQEAIAALVAAAQKPADAKK
jgi:predicted Zn-dependent protease